jgi:hypothetical protein
MENKPTLLSAVLIPGLAAGVTGLLAGLLAAALGGNGPVIGLFAALGAWVFRPGVLPAINLPAGKNEQTVKLHLVSDAGRAGDFIALDIDQERLRTLAAGLVGGRALSCREWTGKGALFSQAEFARLRSDLITRGLVRWVSARDPRSGVVLTAKGKATFLGLAALPQQVPPAEEDPQKGYTKKAHTRTQQDQTILNPIREDANAIR